MELVAEADIIEINGRLVDDYMAYPEVWELEDTVFTAKIGEPYSSFLYNYTAKDIEESVLNDTAGERLLITAEGALIKFMTLTTL